MTQESMTAGDLRKLMANTTRPSPPLSSAPMYLWSYSSNNFCSPGTGGPNGVRGLQTLLGQLGMPDDPLPHSRAGGTQQRHLRNKGPSGKNTYNVFGYLVYFPLIYFKITLNHPESPWNAWYYRITSHVKCPLSRQQPARVTASRVENHTSP